METQTDLNMKESNSIGCGNDDIMRFQATSTQATDARDMVKDLT